MRCPQRKSNVETRPLQRERGCDTHILGELGAVELTLRAFGGVSVRSFMAALTARMAGGIGVRPVGGCECEGCEVTTSWAGGGRGARCCSGVDSRVEGGRTPGKEEDGGCGSGCWPRRSVMTSLARRDCEACRRPVNDDQIESGGGRVAEACEVVCGCCEEYGKENALAALELTVVGSDGDCGRHLKCAVSDVR